MTCSVRASTVLFSLAFHMSLLGGLYMLSDGKTPEEIEVYRVDLAEFAAAAPALPEEVQPDPPQEAPLPEPEQTPPAPEPESEPEPAPLPEPEPEPPVEKAAPEPETPPEAPAPEPDVRKVSPVKKKEVPLPRKEKPKPRPKAKAEPKPLARPAAADAAAIAQPAAPAGPQAVRIGGYMAYKQDQIDHRPSIVRMAKPDYPARARRLGVSGKVTVQLVVDISGNPVEAQVKNAEPAGYFEEAALAAARKMRFMPGKLKGRPVNTMVLVPFNFSLR